jgi:hypothetical protein
VVREERAGRRPARILSSRVRKIVLASVIIGAAMALRALIRTISQVLFAFV